MKNRNKKKKVLTASRTTWEQFHNLKLKAAIMERHLKYQALYGDAYNPPVLKN